MIKNFEPQPYDGLNPLPSYVTNVSSFTLTRFRAAMKLPSQS